MSFVISDRSEFFYRLISHALSIHVFFFNDTATTEIYTLSLHDALPISRSRKPESRSSCPRLVARRATETTTGASPSLNSRSEEHTSELQSHSDLVCRLLLEKKKKKKIKKHKYTNASSS